MRHTLREQDVFKVGPPKPKIVKLLKTFVTHQIQLFRRQFAWPVMQDVESTHFALLHLMSKVTYFHA